FYNLVLVIGFPRCAQDFQKRLYSGGLFSSAGPLSALPLSGCRGSHAPAFCGADGFTPKSQTNKLICFLSSNSTTAYSPGGRGCEGVSLTQSPNAEVVTGIQLS